MTVLLVALCNPVTAGAIDQINTNANASLTLMFSPGESQGDGAEFRIYRIADVNEFGTFTPCGEFAKDYTASQFNDLQREEWDAIAGSLEQYVQQKEIKADHNAVIAHGKAKIEGLKVGLYLVTSKVYIHENKCYLTKPTLVSLPDRCDPNDANHWVYQVTIQPKADSFDHGDIQVQKIWKDDHVTEHPAIVVQLLVDNAVYDEVTLSQENSWKAAFSKRLKSGVNWSVQEKDVPEGYEWSWEWRSDGKQLVVTVTNTPQKPPTTEPTLPQTGQLWWPVPLLAGGGMILLFAAWKRRGVNEKE